MLRKTKIHYGFIKGRHWSLSWTRSIQFIPPHRISLRSVLIRRYPHNDVFLMVPFFLAFPAKPCMHSSSFTYILRDPPVSSSFTLSFLLYLSTTTIYHLKVLITKFSPLSCHFIPLQSKYSAQHPVLKHPSTFFGSVGCGETLSTWYVGHELSIVPGKNHRWVWSIWWSENLKGKLKYEYSEETCPSATLSTTNPTWHRNWAAAVGSRFLNAWAMARPLEHPQSMFLP
jgi:hypothetical protein